MPVVLRYLSFIFIISLMTACTSGSDQYQSDELRPEGDQGKLGGELPTTPGEPTIPDDGNKPIDEEELRKKIIANSSKPIVYGESAGGVDMKTLYSDSLKLLSPAFYGPDEDGLAAYDEGIYVYWRKDNPRTPDTIFVNTGYIGTVALPAPYGEVGISQELKQHFPANDPFGNKMIKALHIAFEKKDVGYDCLVEKTCQLVTTEEQFIQFIFPSMVMLFSKDDRKSLFRIVIVKNNSPGKLDNDFDILNGKVLVPSESGEVSQSLSIGMTWEEFSKKAEATSDNTLTPRAFIKRFQGIGLGISKSKFDRDYLEPEGSEKVNSIAFYSGYLKTIRIGDKAVQVEINGDEVVLNLVDLPFGLQDSEKPKNLLQVQMKSLENETKLAKNLVTKLTALLLQKISQKVSSEPDVILMSQITGLSAKGEGREFEANISHFNPSQNTGFSLGFSIDEKTGGMSFFTSLLDHPFNLLMQPPLAMPIVAGSNQLSGLELGDQVILKDIDKGKGEATLVFVHAAKSLEARVTYSSEGQIVVAYEIGGKLKEVPQKQEVAELNGVNLGLQEISSSDDAKTFEIITLNGGNTVGIDRLCGLSKLTPIGMSEFKFSSHIQNVKALAKTGKATAKKKAKKIAQLEASGGLDSTNPDHVLTEEEKNLILFGDCKFMVPLDSNQAGNREVYYFPQQRIKVLFNKSELSRVTIYKKPQLATNGGGQ